MSATPEARCVWLDETQIHTLEEVIRAWTFDGCDSGYLHPEEVRKLKAMRCLLDQWDAAPADPAEAVEAALTEGLPTLSGVVRAVLVALGYPDDSQRQETPTCEHEWVPQVFAGTDGWRCSRCGGIR